MKNQFRKMREVSFFCKTLIFKTDDAFMAAIAATDKKELAQKRREHLAELKKKYFGTKEIRRNVADSNDNVAVN